MLYVIYGRPLRFYRDWPTLLKFMWGIDFWTEIEQFTLKSLFLLFLTANSALMVQTSCYLKRHLERFLTSFGLDWPTAYGYFWSGIR